MMILIRLPWLRQCGGPLLAARALPLRCAASAVLISTLAMPNCRVRKALLLSADLVFKWQNGVLIAPVNPRLSQVVRSTPLGVPCSELQ
jgi:hypothetical protein